MQIEQDGRYVEQCQLERPQGQINDKQQDGGEEGKPLFVDNEVKVQWTNYRRIPRRVGATAVGTNEVNVVDAKVLWEEYYRRQRAERSSPVINAPPSDVDPDVSPPVVQDLDPGELPLAVALIATEDRIHYLQDLHDNLRQDRDRLAQLMQNAAEVSVVPEDTSRSKPGETRKKLPWISALLLLIGLATVVVLAVLVGTHDAGTITRENVSIVPNIAKTGKINYITASPFHDPSPPSASGTFESQSPTPLLPTHRPIVESSKGSVGTTRVPTITPLAFPGARTEEPYIDTMPIKITPSKEADILVTSPPMISTACTRELVDYERCLKTDPASLSDCDGCVSLALGLAKSLVCLLFEQDFCALYEELSCQSACSSCTSVIEAYVGCITAPDCKVHCGNSRSPSAGSNLPTAMPSPRPSMLPSLRPIQVYVDKLIHQPSSQPTYQSMLGPILKPTIQPTVKLISDSSVEPTSQPAFIITSQPIFLSTTSRTAKPISEPTLQPTPKPTLQPTPKPTFQSTTKPTIRPTVQPTTKPTVQPTTKPTVQHTTKPAVQPTSNPTLDPVVPTLSPSLVAGVIFHDWDDLMAAIDQYMIDSSGLPPIAS